MGGARCLRPFEPQEKTLHLARDPPCARYTPLPSAASAVRCMLPRRDPWRMDDAIEEHRHDIAADFSSAVLWRRSRRGGFPLEGLPVPYPSPPRYGPRPVSSLHRLLGRIDGRQSKGRLGQLPSRNRHFSFFFSVCSFFVLPCSVACRSIVNCKWMTLSNPPLADLRG